MDLQLISDYNSFRKVSAHSAFCHAPSVNMYFSQNGDVKVCCHNTQFTIGTYPRQSIKEIWNCNKAEELREYLKKYDLTHGCEACDFELNMRGFNEIPARHFDTLPRNPQYPSMMEFLLTNTCNLECVMCRGEFSSLIRKNRENLPPLHSPYDNNFLNQLKEFIPHLKEVRFSGSGEAFMIDLNYDIWEMIIRLNPSCLITVQTNGTILSGRLKGILERGNFQIGISLDSVHKENYEAIRLNANFEKVMENIRWFSEYSSERKKHFMLAMCVMRQNWIELPAFISLCNELSAYAVLHKVWFPASYALHNLPSGELKKIYDTLSAFNYNALNSLQHGNLLQYRYFIKVIKNWHEEAKNREKSNQHLRGCSDERLLELIGEKMKSHIAKMHLADEEKISLLNACLDKLQKVISVCSPDEQVKILKLIYLEKPAKMVAPLAEQPVEVLYASAKNFLFVNAGKQGESLR